MNARRFPGIPALAVAILASATPAAAQLTAVELRWDNDLFALRGAGAPPDHDYTQGLELAASFAVPAAGSGGEHVAPRDPVAARIAIGQRIYTPRRDAPEPLTGERPYAAWLYGAATLRSRHGHAEHVLGLEIGLTGPAALGEEVQNAVHHLLGSTPQLGWDHQLASEVAALATYAIGWPVELGHLRLKPLIEAGVGTRWSGAALEIRAGVGPRGAASGLYGVAALRQEWVLRNLFLDGNTSGSRRPAERIPLVTGVLVGAGYRFSRWSAGYELTVRGREYSAQPGPHPYGSFIVSWYP